MKAVIMPGFSELIIVVNPTEEVKREGLLSLIMPWLYAPWPDSQSTGIIQLEVEGETLRALLTELSEQYKQADVDFEPIAPGTNDLDFDYDAFINGKNYVTLPNGLDAKLRDDDRIIVKMVWRWDG